MKRLPDWPMRLADYIESRHRMPFAWGSNDCAAFAAGAVHAITGQNVDMIERASAADAARLLASDGLIDRLDAIFGARCAVQFVRRGDIALLDLDGRPTCGVCTGAMVAAPGADGVLLLPKSRTFCGWRVG